MTCVYHTAESFETVWNNMEIVSEIRLSKLGSMWNELGSWLGTEHTAEHTSAVSEICTPLSPGHFK